MSQQIIDNLKRAIAIIDAIPEQRLDLELFRRDITGEPDCGTICCTAGWLAQDAHFQAQGMQLSIAHTRTAKRQFWLLHKSGTEPVLNYEYAWLDELFGPDAFDALFNEYGCGDHDEDLCERFGGLFTDADSYNRSVSDKQLALLRLRHRLDAMLAA